MGKLTALTLLVLASPIAGAKEDSYVQVAASFFKSRIALQSGGLPEPGDLPALRKYLTPGFIEALATAKSVESTCVEVTPRGIKPPIWEGAVFAGSVETAERAKVGVAYFRARQPHVPVRLYVIDKDEHGNPEDRVGHVVVARLSHTTGAWLISDLIYDDGESLRSALASYSTQRCLAPSNSFRVTPDGAPQLNR